MKEADMQRMFRKYLQKNPPKQTEAYELKICKGTSIPFNAVAEHQVEGLLNAEKDLYHRLTDQAWHKDRPGFTYKKPFDCFHLVEALSFVVVWFYVPRTPKVFYKIPIQKWLDCEREADRKSATREMVAEMATEEILIIPKEL